MAHAPLSHELARADQVERLAAGLRTHALAEENGLYAWAEAELPETTRGAVLLKLRERLAALAGP